MLKVLQVYKDYYPPVFGGIEQHLSLLCRTIRSYCNVRVLVSAGGELRTYREVVDGVEVTRVGEVARVASAPISPTMPFHLAHMKSDIYHFHFPNPTGDVSYWLSGAKGKIVVTYHSDIVRQSTILPLYRPFLHRLLDRADAILATSPQYVESSEYLRPFKDKCDIVPLGIDLRRFETSPQIEERAVAWRAEMKVPFVLFVGRLRYYKGLEVLLAKDAIREQIYHYSRGLDRMDREMSLNVWHKDGTAEYLLGPDNKFKGTGAEFVEWVFKAHLNVTAHSHQMTNIIISVDGDKATSETYGLNSLYNAKTGSTAFTRSRYQDRWSKRNGRWAIDHRQELVDFRTTSVETGAKSVVMGKRDRTDASYAIVPF